MVGEEGGKGGGEMGLGQQEHQKVVVIRSCVGSVGGGDPGGVGGVGCGGVYRRIVSGRVRWRGRG